MKRLAAALLAGGTCLAIPLATLPAQAASAPVVRTASCTAGSHAKLTLYREDQRIETEFELHAKANGQNWRVRIRHNGHIVYNKLRSIQPPHDSFSANVLVVNAAGTDAFRARAVNLVTNEVCRVHATY